MTWAFLSGVHCCVSKRNIQCMFGFACGVLEIQRHTAGAVGLVAVCPAAIWVQVGPGWQQDSDCGLPLGGGKFVIGLACFKSACGHLNSVSDNRP